VTVTTDAGRIIAICLMVTGIGFIAVLTAAAQGGPSDMSLS